MHQLNLFPPSAAPPKRLSGDARNVARNLLSDLLVAVMTARSSKQKLHDEKQEGQSDD